MKDYGMNKSLLQFDILKGYPSLFHFSTTIIGGISGGSYSTFNLGEYSGDTPGNISENRRILTNMLGINRDDLFLPYQVHGDKVVVIDDDFLSSNQMRRKELIHGTDALVTGKPGICIGVTTADCVPVLLYDPVNNVLGAVHAGWRSTVARIVSKTIRVMNSNFGSSPENVIACIAPSICQECFEVGDEVAEIFDKANFPMDEINYRKESSGKAHIDLQLANRLLLQSEGVLLHNIEISSYCTCCNPAMFFSARRQTVNSGRMVTGGVLR